MLEILRVQQITHVIESGIDPVVKLEGRVYDAGRRRAEIEGTGRHESRPLMFGQHVENRNR